MQVVTSGHSVNRELPLPLYIGMKMNTETRSKKMITQSYSLGILHLENQLVNVVGEDYRSKGVVVPSQLQHELFTQTA